MSDALDQLERTGLLAVLRGDDPEAVVDGALVLVGAGVEVLEVTFTVPDAPQAIAALRDRAPAGTLIGAGTVTTPAEVQAATEAGASFLVSPGVTPSLLDSLRGTGIPFIPGVMTPSDVLLALEAGAEAVKLFPGALAGPSALRALRGPFPGLRVVPTGGVTLDTIGHWFAAGAIAVGAGSELAPPTAIARRDAEVLRALGNRWRDAVTATRSQRRPEGTSKISLKR